MTWKYSKIFILPTRHWLAVRVDDSTDERSSVTGLFGEINPSLILKVVISKISVSCFLATPMAEIVTASKRCRRGDGVSLLAAVYCHGGHSVYFSDFTDTYSQENLRDCHFNVVTTENNINMNKNHSVWLLIKVCSMTWLNSTRQHGKKCEAIIHWRENKTLTGTKQKSFAVYWKHIYSTYRTHDNASWQRNSLIPLRHRK